MTSGTSGPVSPSDFEEIIRMMWGTEVKEEVFQRWKQGFRFSADEPTALVQDEGGPCAVLAPVQAFILKSVIASYSKNWREMDSDMVNKVLVHALCEILSQVNCKRFVLVELPCQNDTASPAADNPPAEKLLDHVYFHSRLRVLGFDNVDDVKSFYLERIEMLKETFGVLLFLYSVVCTKDQETVRQSIKLLNWFRLYNSHPQQTRSTLKQKCPTLVKPNPTKTNFGYGVEAVHLWGLERLVGEVGDGSEPFIDAEFGYGSQCLINLMITGRAVGHVWNYQQDVGGLKLKGIDKQSTVGFLTLLEHLRYCEVGSFLKNPMDPVWVVASDTHLSVLFSFEKGLVSAETPSEMARRVFKCFDPEGNNFIQSENLQEVLKRLQLVSEPPEYVDIMRKKLDNENLGIILLPAFMDEFFPDETMTSLDIFTLFHYNGLVRSCHDKKVRYQEGEACLLESHLTAVLDSNPILTCLQTKWPTIDIRWLSGVTPSLN